MSPRAERLRCVVRRRALGVAVLVAVLMAATSAGCGLGAGSAPTAVKLTVTRDFGAQVVRSESAPKVRGEETVMSLLMRNATVTTKYGGGFVQSIDGLSGGSGRRTAAGLVLLRQRHRGAQGRGRDERACRRSHLVGSARLEPDRQRARSRGVVSRSVREWDRRQTVAGARRMRLGDERVRARRSSRACSKLGVLAPLAAIGPGNEPETLRLMVGPWTAVSGDPTVHEIESGPGSSGVYARIGGERVNADAAERTGLDRPYARRGSGTDRGHAQRRRRPRLGRHGHR